jgi:putative phage-type endonuclease
MSNPTIDIAADLKGRLGCSEVAAALGVSKYKTPYRLWAEKTGRLEPDPPSLAMRLGVPMEPVIKALWEERTGGKLRRSHKKLEHPTLPLVGHLDYVEVGGKSRLVDCKSSLSFGGRRRYGEDESDEVPEEHLCQGQTYLLLTGKKLIDFAVLMAGPEFKVFTVQADPDMQAMIEEGIRKFWVYVETDQPPPLETAEDAYLQWPLSTPEATVTATPTQEQIVASLNALKAEIATKTTMAEAAVTLLKSYLEDNEVLLSGEGKKLCSWKTQTARRLEAKRLKADHAELYEKYTNETQSRVFRLAGEK